jgi:hypothetical protein
MVGARLRDEGRNDMTEPWTPGPWETKPFQWEGDLEDDEGAALAAELLGRQPLAVVRDQNVAEWDPFAFIRARNKGDALLIAAAPEMAELLAKMVKGLQPAGLKPQAEALLSRIRGDSPGPSPRLLAEREQGSGD